MTTQLLPTAEHILELGIRRGLDMIRQGRAEDARRCLAVATAAAELVELDADELVDAQLWGPPVWEVQP